MLTYLTVIIGWIIFRFHDVFQLSSWMHTLLTPTAYIQSSQHWFWGIIVIVALIVLKVLFEFFQREYQSNKMNKLRPILYIQKSFYRKEYFEQLRRYLINYGIPLYNLSDMESDNHIPDTIHLSDEGATSFTQILFDEVIRPQI